MPDRGAHEEHLADMATAWIEDHPYDAIKVLDRRVGGLFAAGWVVVESGRLEALEGIRQRVADGWRADRGYDFEHKAPVWIRSGRFSEEISPNVAAVLWPTTEPEWSGGTMSDAIEENTGD